MSSSKESNSRKQSSTSQISANGETEKNNRNINTSSSHNNSENGSRHTQPSTPSKKKFGLLSSLHNASNGIVSTGSTSGRIDREETVTERELLDKYRKGSPITPSDVMKLNKYTERKFQSFCFCLFITSKTFIYKV